MNPCNRDTSSAFHWEGGAIRVVITDFVMSRYEVDHLVFHHKSLQDTTCTKQYKIPAERILTEGNFVSYNTKRKFLHIVWTFLEKQA